MSDPPEQGKTKPPFRDRLRQRRAGGAAWRGGHWTASKVWVDAPANRWKALLLAVAVTIIGVAVVNWATGSELFRKFFFPKPCGTGQGHSCDSLPWRDLFQAIVLVLGLPVAFLLWHWRDRNVRDQIIEQRNQVENQRKDVNLKEFQEVQLRAAGALDDKLPGEAREQLQIAALHQLRGFLRGEYGDAFRRPAFELLLAGHTAAMEKVGLKQAVDDAQMAVPIPLQRSMQRTFRKAIVTARRQWSPVTRERAGIVRDEWEAVFLQGFPLNDRRLDGLELPPGISLAHVDFAGSTFIGAALRDVRFEGANLSHALFQGADLTSCSFEGANLSGADLEGAELLHARLSSADLSSAQLRGAYLRFTQLMNANLVDACLEGAELTWARLEGADLTGAQLTGADLQWSRLDGAVLNKAHLQRMNFNGAQLTGAKLPDAHLEHANLNGVPMEGANLRGARLDNSILIGAKMRRADLSKAHLCNADMTWADLRDVNLNEAQLQGTNMRLANLDGAKLTDAIFDDNTILLIDWDDASQAQRDQRRDELRARGALHANDPVEVRA